MAGNLIELRRRIKSVKDTQKTTKAMKTVSAAKLRRSVMDLNRTKPIMEKIRSLLKRSGEAGDFQDNPFLAPREDGKTVIIAVSADKGLCGAFNAHVIHKAETHYNQRLKDEGRNLELIIVGNKAYKHFKKREYPISKEYRSMMTRLKHQDALDISVYLQELFLNSSQPVKRIEFVFTEYLSAARQELTVRQLFPIETDWDEPVEPGNNYKKPGTPSDEFIFEPSPEAIFRALLPRYIDTLVYQILLSSSASEHASRMLAMDTATNNASDMIRSLTLTLNKLRQASITTELLEIITATEAMKK